MPPQTTATYEWNDRPSVGTTAAGQKLRLGGFSGLRSKASRRRQAQVHHAHRPRPERRADRHQSPFLLPDFKPHIVRFTLDPRNGQLRAHRADRAARRRRPPLTGLPNTALSADANQPYNDEVPVDLRGNVLPLDPLGGDFEGIVVADDGSFWMADEYRPAIYHFSKHGRLIERLVPIGTHAAAGAAGAAGRRRRHVRHRSVAGGARAAPPESRHRSHRDSGRQDLRVRAEPDPQSGDAGNGALNAMQNVRLVEFDPATRAHASVHVHHGQSAGGRRGRHARRQDRRHGRGAGRRLPRRRARRRFSARGMQSRRSRRRSMPRRWPVRRTFRASVPSTSAAEC